VAAQIVTDIGKSNNFRPMQRSMKLYPADRLLEDDDTSMDAWINFSLRDFQPVPVTREIRHVLSVYDHFLAVYPRTPSSPSFHARSRIYQPTVLGEFEAPSGLIRESEIEIEEASSSSEIEEALPFFKTQFALPEIEEALSSLVRGLNALVVHHPSAL